MNRNTLILVRGVLGLAFGMLLVVAAALILDVNRWGYFLSGLTNFNYDEARFLADSTNRGLNQVLAIAFTVVAIAVPLTANLYSLKFLEFFIKDRVNAAVLTLVVFADLASFWVIYALKKDFIPVFQLHLAFGLLVVCLIVIFPYLYYVFRFLHPNTLLERLEDEIEAGLRSAVRNRRKAERYQQPVAEGIEHIANIAIRSIDRTDRTTAIESVLTLEETARRYWKLKPKLPPAWFVAEPNFFLGFSSKAVDDFSAKGIWVEMKLFSQLRQVMSAAIPRTHNVVSTAAKASRKLGLEPIAQKDEGLRELVTEYFNTFIRLALTRRDVPSVFTLFDQYRIFAETLNHQYPQLGLDIGYYFAYYGELAHKNQLNFVVDAVAHDLGTLVRRAWETGAANRQTLLDRFLRYGAQHPLRGVRRAQAILASYFLLTEQTEAAQLVRKNLADLDQASLQTLKDQLLSVKREQYWEINERRAHMDYVPEPQREKLKEFLESLG